MPRELCNTIEEKSKGKDVFNVIYIRSVFAFFIVITERKILLWQLYRNILEV